MAIQDFDDDDDIDGAGSYRQTKMGRAKEALKDGLSDVQRRFDTSNIHFDWKKIVPVALMGTLGAIVYSRRRGLNNHLTASGGRSKSKRGYGHKSGGTTSKSNTHRTQA